MKTPHTVQSEKTSALRLAETLLDDPSCDSDDSLRTLARQLLRVNHSYQELLLAVESRYEEPRHDTALRYIKEREQLATREQSHE